MTEKTLLQWDIPQAEAFSHWIHEFWPQLLLAYLLGSILATIFFTTYFGSTSIADAFLVFTAVNLAIHDDIEVHPERNPAIRFARKYFPVTRDYEGGKFFSRAGGKFAVTPLFLVLVMIETTDLAFATDSIPAIFAISRDPFIIYTSNILAVMGLRSLYFVVAGFLRQFRFLKYGLSLVLGFIGIKMLAEPWVLVPITTSLMVIFTILAFAIGLSAFIRPSGNDGSNR